ncbi:diguanylate cyclase [Yersinia intermedia]|jgi:diguanylate cyclase (GGDEF)-like protein|uniref:diguanylate cyclase n=1 Tax=Yersinia intermedia TaxID=631 RepID=A0A208ZGI7_YERIN|nr:diguanylate cyclase [Yersinia intermedia]MCB5314957.1 diguanylate cyclase [Yersinia intermedia]MCB5328942.1 diguanylate cyclase [Yersinia intermedia]OVZ79598.1 diguanylate cyclase response regulator [Yersinia intermedia]UNK25016.1 diguanylate cyclase [Yersinia intermedia]WET14073.1 diguanylate cyclase [Yersinia intermedia]
MTIIHSFSQDLTLSLPSTGKSKILIVDDHPINIQMLYQAFSSDYHVCMATNGKQALDVCISQHPDLILLDIEMPGMNGFEVCAKLKASPDTQDIPVIFVTAHIDEETETRCFSEGAVDFISKPINRNTVRARVKTHLLLKAQSDLLRQLVYLDGLTEVHNRRYFDKQLDLEWKLSNRNQTPLSMIMIDVDFFKKYNDLYGHQGGDDCLRNIAKVIRDALRRPADLVARYGGEEFVCLLPDTELAGAMELAETIRLQILEQKILHAGSTVYPFVSISLGVCCKETNSTCAPEDLLLQADSQLYQAKKNGRNQTCGEFLME